MKTSVPLLIFLINTSRILDHEVFDLSVLADFHYFKAFICDSFYLSLEYSDLVVWQFPWGLHYSTVVPIFKTAKYSTVLVNTKWYGHKCVNLWIQHSLWYCIIVISLKNINLKKLFYLVNMLFLGVWYYPVFGNVFDRLNWTCNDSSRTRAQFLSV